MKWHLVASSGIVRSCEAGSLAEARVRLRPIPEGHSVMTDYSVDLVKQVGVTPPAPKKKARDYRKTRNPNHPARLEVQRLAVGLTKDREIADQLGISRERVAQLRESLLIPSSKVRRWEAVRLLLAEGLADKEVAERLKITRQCVARVRKGLNIPKNKARPAREVTIQLGIERRRAKREAQTV